MPTHFGSRQFVVDGVSLSLKTPPEQFLQAVIRNYETAARFVLDSSLADPAEVAGQLASFLTKVHQELNTDVVLTGDAYLKPRPGVKTTFGDKRPSFSHVALRRFCELLFESPRLVALVQANPGYANALGEHDFFRYRAISHIALTRGNVWNPTRYTFLDPEPIPPEAKMAYFEQLEANQRAHIREVEANEAIRQAEKEARRKLIEPRLIEERQRSAENKAFRDQLSALPLVEQVRRLALDETHSIRAFPTDANKITIEVLRQVDRSTREHLLRRISIRWEKYWQQLAYRIRVVQSEDDSSV